MAVISMQARKQAQDLLTGFVQAFYGPTIVLFWII